MYESYFGLREHPFAITPDPNYLYLSPQHQEALAHLLYGVRENGGFVQLTGEVGTGKTTLIRSLLAQQPPQADIALCLNPKLTALELVTTICDELGVDYPLSTSLKPLIDALNQHLLASHASGRHTVVIIDEAQNLSPEVLEQVRLLTNLETHHHKLLRIILVGQPELKTLLAQPQLRQLAQRITARYHLPPLSRAESQAYISHRLKVAGARPDLFKQRALNNVYRWTHGIPRLINVICDRALLGAYVQQQSRIGHKTIDRAATEVFYGGEQRKFSVQTPTKLALAASLVLGLALALRPLYLDQSASAVPPPSPELAQLTASPTPVVDSITDLEIKPAVPVPADDIDLLPKTAKVAPPALLTVDPVPIAVKVQSVVKKSDLEPPPEIQSSSLVSDPVIDIATLFDDESQATVAVSALSALWGLPDAKPAATRDDVCKQVRGEQLECLIGQANWSDFKAFNRPAVLTVVVGDGRERTVLLHSLNDDTAVVQSATMPRVSVALEQLKSMWTGEFWLFWRPPVTAKLIGPGTVGESVVWLRRQLALIDGKLPGPDQSVERYDADLEARVRLFQRSRRLVVDGLVGAKTMLLLNNIAPQPGTPLLDEASGDNV